MWKVKIEDEAALVFEGDELTDDDRIIIQKWAETVIKLGFSHIVTVVVIRISTQHDYRREKE